RLAVCYPGGTRTAARDSRSGVKQRLISDRSLHRGYNRASRVGHHDMVAAGRCFYDKHHRESSLDTPTRTENGRFHTLGCGPAVFFLGMPGFLWERSGIGKLRRLPGERRVAAVGAAHEVDDEGARGVGELEGVALHPVDRVAVGLHLGLD